MLRDVAYALRNTPARFDVGWDATNGIITLLRGTAYSDGAPAAASRAAANATPSEAIVYANGVRLNLRAFNIDDRNYFMLVDLGAALGFEVGWDSSANAVLIDTSETEQPETPLPTATPAPPTPTPPPAATPAPRPTTGGASDFVRAMGPGWNLGNQFDAWDRSINPTSTISHMETLWGNPAVTREFIQAVRDAGFTTIRIPVTWHKASSGTNHTIRTDFMARVREVVQWAYDLNMTVIINTHHDSEPNNAIGLANGDIDQSIAILTSWWGQIAREFNGFGDRLIFESLNEPRTRQNEWNGGVPETRANLNRLNQAFVETVRATGGNNATRYLMIPTHGASADSAAFNGFVVPRDTATDRLILSIHVYSPHAWAHDNRGTYGGEAAVRRDLERVQRNAQALGLPVILGEWGSVGTAENLSMREQHAYDYVRVARELGMATIWWDNGQSGNSGNHTFGVFNRRTREMTRPTIIDAIMRAHR
jgi:endoglucanase